MAVFTAPISLLPRSTGNTPIFRRNQRTSGMENSCFFAMIRRLKLWGMASTSRMGSHALEWLAHRIAASSSKFSVPRSSTGRKNSTMGRRMRHALA